MTHPLSCGNISIFHWKSANLLYQKIQIQIAFFNSVNFFVALKIVLLHMVTILMMSAKIITPNLHKIKIFLKTSWRHAFYPWRYQQNFNIWLELYCRYGHAAKIWWVQHYYEKSYQKLIFIKMWSEKPIFFRVLMLVQVH